MTNNQSCFEHHYCWYPPQAYSITTTVYLRSDELDGALAGEQVVVHNSAQSDHLGKQREHS